MPRLFVAGFDTETNSFSPIPTGRGEFEEGMLAFGDATARPLNSCSLQLATWREAAQAKGWEVVESVCAVAEPGGPISRAFYEATRDRIVSDVREAQPDMVLLALHGAMIADGYDDTEGDILSRVRATVGATVPIGALLDLHCHLTQKMVDNADLLLTYKEYPHTDIAACASELFGLMMRLSSKAIRPTSSLFDCRMVGAFPTQRPIMRAFVHSLIKQERSDPHVLSISLAHGFAHGDVLDAGVRVLAITDGDSSGAEELAKRIGRRFYELRDAVMPAFVSVPEAVDAMAAREAGREPLLVADTGDNPGGGAAGDATFLLKALLDRQVTGVGMGIFWDPVALKFCLAAGEGAVIDLRIGGKCSPMSGDPVDLRGATVKAIRHCMTQRFGTAYLPMGTAAWIECQGIDIVVNDLRTQVFDHSCMSDLGIDVGGRKAVVVKSLNHFAAGFCDISSDVIYVSSPGTTSTAYSSIPYQKKPLNFWPRVADPWQSDSR